jgi:hypothetical protein
MLINAEIDQKLRNQILKHDFNGMIIVGEPTGSLNLVESYLIRENAKIFFRNISILISK